MPLITPVTPLTAYRLPDIIIHNGNGNGFSFAEPGSYSVVAPVPWYYSASDSQDIEDMTAVDAGVAVVFTVTSATITRYCKIAAVNELVNLRVTYDLPISAESSAIAGLTGAADKVPYFTAAGAADLASFGRIIGGSAQAVSITGTGSDSENTLASFTLPAGALKNNGRLHVYTLWSFTGSTNDKLLKIKLGSTNFVSRVQATAASLSEARIVDIYARGRTSQICVGVAGSTGIGTNTAVPGTGTENLDTDLTCLITGQLETTSETLTLEAWQAIIFNP